MCREQNLNVPDHIRFHISAETYTKTFFNCAASAEPRANPVSSRRHPDMGNASSFNIAQQCLGPEVAPPVVKSLAGATQQVIEVRNQYRHKNRNARNTSDDMFNVLIRTKRRGFLRVSTRLDKAIKIRCKPTRSGDAEPSALYSARSKYAVGGRNDICDHGLSRKWNKHEQV